MSGNELVQVSADEFVAVTNERERNELLSHLRERKRAEETRLQEEQEAERKRQEEAQRKANEPVVSDFQRGFAAANGVAPTKGEEFKPEGMDEKVIGK